MSNMSYCRFQNTAGDLADCQRALERLLRCEEEEDGDGRALSRRELDGAKQVVQLCQTILELVAEEADEQIEDVTEIDIEMVLDEANVKAEKVDAVEDDSSDE
jgi:hypothetical protein